MQTIKTRLTLTKADYNLIMANLRDGQARSFFNRQEAEDLEKELKNAKLVSIKNIPADIVRLNSTVTIKDEATGNEMEIMIVPPGKANIKDRKISVMSPIGTALIGYQKGNTVKWNVPAGRKSFTILKVENQELSENDFTGKEVS